MAQKYLVIPVRKKHIREGVGGDVNFCAIAVAAKAELEKQGYEIGDVSVGDGITIAARKESDSMTCDLHLESVEADGVSEFIHEFDALKELEDELANGNYGEGYEYENRRELQAAVTAQRAKVQPTEIRIPL